jgi:hypothetical protein
VGVVVVVVEVVEGDDGVVEVVGVLGVVVVPELVPVEEEPVRLPVEPPVVEPVEPLEPVVEPWLPPVVVPLLIGAVWPPPPVVVVEWPVDAVPVLPEEEDDELEPGRPVTMPGDPPLVPVELELELEPLELLELLEPDFDPELEGWAPVPNADEPRYGALPLEPVPEVAGEPGVTPGAGLVGLVGSSGLVMCFEPSPLRDSGFSTATSDEGRRLRETLRSAAVPPAVATTRVDDT